MHQRQTHTLLQTNHLCQVQRDAAHMSDDDRMGICHAEFLSVFAKLQIVKPKLMELNANNAAKS